MQEKIIYETIYFDHSELEENASTSKKEKCEDATK